MKEKTLPDLNRSVPSSLPPNKMIDSEQDMSQMIAQFLFLSPERGFINSILSFAKSLKSPQCTFMSLNTAEIVVFLRVLILLFHRMTNFPGVGKTRLHWKFQVRPFFLCNISKFLFFWGGVN